MKRRAWLAILGFMVAGNLRNSFADGTPKLEGPDVRVDTLAPVEDVPEIQLSFFSGITRFNSVDKTNGEVAAALNSVPQPGVRFLLGHALGGTLPSPFLSIELEQYRFPETVGNKRISQNQPIAPKLAGGLRMRPWAENRIYFSPALSFDREPFIYATSTHRLVVESVGLFELSLLANYEIPQSPDLRWILSAQLSAAFSSETPVQTIRNGYGAGMSAELQFRTQASKNFLSLHSWFLRASVNRNFRNSSLSDVTLDRYMVEVGANWSPTAEESVK